MGNVVVTEFISLDGVIEDPGGSESYKHGAWTFDWWSDELGGFKLDELRATDALLLGRVTYEGFAKAWPDQEDEAGFAERMNGLPKYVVSRTLNEAGWQNSTIVRDDLSGEVAQLKERHAGDITVHGSATLVRSLLDQDLVDEYRLLVYPVVLGSGRRLFGERDDLAKLELAGTATYPGGVVLLTYRRAATTGEGDGA